MFYYKSNDSQHQNWRKRNNEREYENSSVSQKLNPIKAKIKSFVQIEPSGA